jgi:hypothetical protein
MAVSSYPMGIDWDGFWAMIENTPGIPYQDQILRLKGMNESVVLEMLRYLGGRDTYNFLLNVIYPKLQYAAVRVVLKDGRSIPVVGSPLRKIVETQELVITDTVYIERVIRDTVHIAGASVRDTVRIVETVPVYEHELEYGNRKRFYIALKNNLIFDAALLPNLAVEIPFGRNYGWSAEIEGHWSWWNTQGPNWWFHRVQQGGLELRKWFGNRTGDPMHGWYVGLYGYAGTYDIRLFANDPKDMGQLSDMSWSAGLSAGYAMPLTRRLNMEFGLSVGYLGGIYKKYDQSRCDGTNYFPWLSTHGRNWIGPTKAKVSLVWQIGSGYNRNYKKKKK